MFDTLVPNKIIVFYDKENEGFLIRVVDKNWNEIIKYDSLPALCRLSDFYVDTIDIHAVQVMSDEGTEAEGVKGDFLFNDKITFCEFIDGHTSIGLLNEWTSYDYRMEKRILVEKLKELFGISI